MKPLQRLRLSLLAALAGALALSGCGVIKAVREGMTKPDKPFNQMTPPPAPDFDKPDAWFAFPGRNGLERSTPPGFAAVDEATAPADVFFIHPTMYLHNDVWNAAYDVAGDYNAPVLLAQASDFNGCCRIYAPHYRQASLAGLKNHAAVELAYGDVAKAFRWYIAHENHGRPFIVASHSQGTGHLVRLLQDEILNNPQLKKQLVAAYAIGAYAPSSFATLGLPACTEATATGCIVSWNTTQKGRTGARMLTRNVDYWWQGKHQMSGTLAAICTNPLIWTADGVAPASANAGALTFPTPPYPKTATTLPALTPHLTGAQCKDNLLEVDVPDSAPKGFHDALTFVYGSYHKNDYGLFYASIRQNASDRVKAWQAAQH
ncbi:MAG TPA: DUF3089 domain-containing protein [Caulobacteraceae bacterium]|jgi:hypothetical protein